jgi:hypothetical protein
MRRFLLFALLSLIGFVAPARAQIIYELACPAGTNPASYGRSFNPTTGKWRAWLCIDGLTGTVSYNDAISGGISPTFGALLSGIALAKTFNIGNASTLIPINLGQIAGSQSWLLFGVPNPALASSAGGGNLAANNTVGVKLSYNTALGETIFSNIVYVTTPGSCPGNNCIVTVTAPTLPTGYTGYTVYDCTGSACTNVLRQNAANACVNITANCVIQTIAAGGSPLTVQTAWVQPPNTQATVCPPAVIPQWFVQDSSGNYQTQAGVDITSNNGTLPVPGTLMFCRRTWFNDFGTPGGFLNSFVNISHSQSGVTTSMANQDRGLSVFAANPSTDAGASTHYAMEAIQVEQDLRGSTPAIGNAIDSEVAALSVQFSDQHTGVGTGTPVDGLDGIRVTATKSSSGTGLPGITGILVQVADSGSGNQGGTEDDGIQIQPPASLGSVTGVSGAGLRIIGPNNRMPGQNYGIYISNYGSNTNDVAIYNSGTVSRILSQGKLGMGSAMLAMNGNPAYDHGISTFGFKASAIGSLAGTSLNIGHGGTAGATSYTYAAVCKDVNDNPTANISQVTTTANATLDVTNYNIVSIGHATGCWSWDIYRTVSGGAPASTGKIGTAITGAQNLLFNSPAADFNDAGLAGDGTTAPASDQSGTISGTRYLTASTCAAAGSAANPSLVACGTAAAGVFSCDAAASGTTCVVSTTAVTATSTITIQESAADSTLLGVTCNAAIDTARTAPRLAAKSAAVSFTINLGTFAVSPQCFEYTITN